MTVNVRGALGFFAACCWRSANRPAAMANDSPSRPARTTRVIILSSSSLDFWEEEPNQPAQPPCVTPHDVDSQRVPPNAESMFAVVHAPAKVLVEGRGAAENPDHVRYALDRPTTDVLVEGVGGLEHRVHGRDAGGVPRADVLVEELRARVFPF